MKKYWISAAIAMSFVGSASANEWQSLGRLNGLTAAVSSNDCEHRIVNRYRPTGAVFYPNHKFGTRYTFDIGLGSLRLFTRNDPALSPFSTAVADYGSRSGAKSINVVVEAGPVPSVFIEVHYSDAQGVRFNTYKVLDRELQYYEVQQKCPVQ
jgi:hypothetical protein